MKPKHTPGPWSVKIDHSSFSNAVIGATLFSNGSEILDLSFTQECGPDDAPNARLIAAAPALLEACELALIAVSQAAELRSQFLKEERVAIDKLVLAIRDACGEDEG